MKYCLIIISLVLSQLLSAQKGNTFTVGMSSGIGMTKNTTIGENNPLDNLSNIHASLNVSYGIQLPKNLRCDINFGLENISYFPYPANIGRSSGSNLLSNLGAGLHYKIPVKKNFFSLGLNGGVRFMGIQNRATPLTQNCFIQKAFIHLKNRLIHLYRCNWVMNSHLKIKIYLVLI